MFFYKHYIYKFKYQFDSLECMLVFSRVVHLLCYLNGINCSTLFIGTLKIALFHLDNKEFALASPKAVTLFSARKASALLRWTNALFRLRKQRWTAVYLRILHTYNILCQNTNAIVFIVFGNTDLSADENVVWTPML